MNVWDSINDCKNRLKCHMPFYTNNEFKQQIYITLSINILAVIHQTNSRSISNMLHNWLFSIWSFSNIIPRRVVVTRGEHSSIRAMGASTTKIFRILPYYLGIMQAVLAHQARIGVVIVIVLLINPISNCGLSVHEPLTIAPVDVFAVRPFWVNQLAVISLICVFPCVCF